MRIVADSPATPGLAISMLLSPMVRFSPAPAPIAVLFDPVVLLRSALSPTAMFELAVVLARSAPLPIAVLNAPVVLSVSAPKPMPVLLSPVVLLPSAKNPGGRVTDTNVFLERERTYCSVAHPYRIIKKSIESNSCVPGAGGVQSECGNPFCRVAATTGITRESTTPDSCVVIGGISKQSAITDCSVVGAFGVAEQGERPVRSIVAPSRII